MIHCVNPIDRARRDSYLGIEGWYRRSAGPNAAAYLAEEFSWGESEAGRLDVFRVRSGDPDFGGKAGEVRCDGELHVYEVFWRRGQQWERVASRCPAWLADERRVKMDRSATTKARLLDD